VELKGAAQKVSGILRNSRSEAVNKGKVYQVVFNSQSREVSVHSMEPSEEKDERKEGPIPAKTYLLPEGIQMKGDPTTSSSSTSELSPIEFYPNGGSNGGTPTAWGTGSRSISLPERWISREQNEEKARVHPVA
jgi:Tfp pilus assembly protein FimT